MERRFGWDTHGLPAELEAMKQLGMTDKMQIEAMGIDKFNDACRTSVMKYADEWQSYVTRQARWVDFENDYKTLNVEYMESVIWAFKQLHEKGLTYQGFRVLPYCWKDETPLSNHELRMDDDVYKNRQDQTVTVYLPAAGRRVGDSPGSSPACRRWPGPPRRGPCPPTWPWPSGPEVVYVVLPAGENGVKAAAPNAVTGELPARRGPARRLRQGPGLRDARGAAAAEDASPRSHTGKDLAGLTYAPLWDTFADVEKFGTPRTPGSCWSPTTSPPPTAPASSTRPRPTARTTRRSARRPASR